MEAALVTPIIIGSILGSIELMNIVRTSITLQRAATDTATIAGAAATASIQGGDSVDSDYIILQKVKEMFTGVSAANIERVVIFHANFDKVSNTSADTTDDVVHPNCLATSSVGFSDADVTTPNRGCNVYYSGDLTKTWTQLNAMPNSDGWPTSERAADLTIAQAASGSAFIGVFVRVNYSPITGVVFPGLTPTSMSRQVYFSYGGG